MTETPDRRTIIHGDTRIEYTLVRSSRRRRTIGITVEAVGDRSQETVGAVIVRAPLRASRAVVEDVVRRKAGWIARKLEEVAQKSNGVRPEIAPEVEARYRQRAQTVLEAAVRHWAPEVGEEQPARVLVRNQKRIWGSCARDGTLRFNWRLALLEESLIDYVVVHELVHLRVRNHQREFWAAVEAVLPDFRERRRRLRGVRLF